MVKVILSDGKGGKEKIRAVPDFQLLLLLVNPL